MKKRSLASKINNHDRKTDLFKMTINTYDAISEDYTRLFSEASPYVDDFASMLPVKGTVLDVGCGPGVDSRRLAFEGFKVAGLDASMNMIKLARKKCPVADFTVMDMRKLAYRSCSFDGLLASFSLIHVPKADVAKVMREFRRVLRERGILYLSLQEGLGEFVLDEPLNPLKKTFLSLFTADEAKRLLTEFGFKTLFFRRCASESKAEFSYDKIFLISKVDLAPHKMTFKYGTPKS